METTELVPLPVILGGEVWPLFLWRGSRAPLVRDLDLAAWLGYERPHEIRRLSYRQRVENFFHRLGFGRRVEREALWPAAGDRWSRGRQGLALALVRAQRPVNVDADLSPTLGAFGSMACHRTSLSVRRPRSKRCASRRALPLLGLRRPAWPRRFERRSSVQPARSFGGGDGSSDRRRNLALLPLASGRSLASARGCSCAVGACIPSPSYFVRMGEVTLSVAPPRDPPREVVFSLARIVPQGKYMLLAALAPLANDLLPSCLSLCVP